MQKDTSLVKSVSWDAVKHSTAFRSVKCGENTLADVPWLHKVRKVAFFRSASSIFWIKLHVQHGDFQFPAPLIHLFRYLSYLWSSGVRLSLQFTTSENAQPPKGAACSIPPSWIQSLMGKGHNCHPHLLQVVPQWHKRPCQLPFIIHKEKRCLVWVGMAELGPWWTKSPGLSFQKAPWGLYQELLATDSAHSIIL